MRMAEARRSELVRPRNLMDTEEGRIESAEAALTRELVAARTNWTEDHPEVQRLERELKALRSKRGEGGNRNSPEAQERARVSGTIGAIQGDVASLRKQAEQFQARLDATPRWAHELAVMNRDYEVAKTKYQSLVSRKVEAELADELENKSARSMFNVISPAYTPLSPAKPDRLGGLLLALLGSLGVGVLAAVFKEMRDDSLQDVQQVKERLPVPLLAVIPNLNTSLLEAGRPNLLPSYTQAPQSQSAFEAERASTGLKQ
jgi:succinoglycan biosynthesis transport protein ExoP